MRLNHISILQLANLILSISFIIYLLQIKSSSKSTKYLTWAIIGNIIMLCGQFIQRFEHWWFPGWNIYFGFIFQYLGLSLAIICFVGFAYYFPELIPRMKKEHKIVMIVYAIINITYMIFLIIYGVFNLLYNFWELEIILTIYESSIGFQFLWMIIIFFRKVILFSNQRDKTVWNNIIHPQGHSAIAARAFGILLILVALIGFSNTISPPSTPIFLYIIFRYLQEMSIFFFMMMFVFLYINFSYDFSTIKIKIVGLTLVLFLTILGLLSFIRGQYNDTTYINKTHIKEESSIQFKPLENGSYVVKDIPYQFDEYLGEKLTFKSGFEKQIIDINFPFTFYEKPYNTIQVSTYGIVLLGYTGELDSSGGFFPLPSIIMLNIGLDTDANNGGVFLKQNPDNLIITWYQLPEIGYIETNTFQLVLTKSGMIIMNYKELNPGGNYSIMNSTSSLMGILPGGRKMPKEHIRFNTDLPYISQPGNGIYEDYLTDFFNYSHRNIVTFAFVMIFSSLFIVLIFPLMLNTSLIKPLYAIKDGIKKVNNGELDVTVKPLYNDEIGYLTTSFNKMVESIKKADKLKDDFLANTSHELRTPLNGIIGIAESLVDGTLGPLSDSAINNLSMIVSSGKRLSSLINDILDFSKLKEGELILQKRPVNIKRHIEVVCLLSKPLITGKDLKLFASIPEGISNVIADQNRLQQILFNLVGNAIKFTHAGEICISAETVGEFVKISIIDTGIGIPEDHLNDIFKSFEQIDASISREYGGTGLGLSITKHLVELHGGDIKVESHINKGSIFSFTLPLSLEEAVDTTTNKEISSIDLVPNVSNETLEIPTKSKSDITILIVDDELINLQVLINHLSISEYQVLQARSGEEALQYCWSKSPPDLILLDIMMPKMNGYEVCQKIRETMPANELPVILLTAKNQVSDLIDGFDSGANDYITKPFSKGELLTRIKTHLELSKINIAYSHFVPHEFLQILHKASIIDLQLGDQIQKDMTIMFSDIRDFTTISEKLKPKETFDFLNTYLEKVVPVIRSHGGFIDKYIGDAILALFPGKIEEVIKTSIHMQREIEVFNQEREDNNLVPISAGIGLHTGNLILGTIGEKSRMEATVISDAVNLASRIEGLTKLYSAPVLISESIYNSLTDKEEYNFRFIGKIKVKGKSNAIAVYEVLDGNIDEQMRLKIDNTETFKTGLDLYYKRDFAEAAVYFNNVLKKNPKDKAAEIYRERSASFLLNPPPIDWDGIETLNIK